MLNQKTKRDRFEREGPIGVDIQPLIDELNDVLDDLFGRPCTLCQPFDDDDVEG